MPKNPFDFAYIGRLSETYLPGIPIPLQRAGLAVLSSVGWLFGYLPPDAKRGSAAEYPAATVSLAGGDSA